MSENLSTVQYFPTSYIQQANWFLYKLNPTGLTGKVSVALRIKSSVSIQNLQHTLQLLTKRHPILCSIYYEQNEKIVQEVRESLEIEFAEIDASSWSDDKLNQQLLEWSKRPLNLETGSVFRACLFSRSGTEHLLLLTIHEIAGDLESLSILVDDFFTIYESITNRVGSSLPSLNKSYRDYIDQELDFVNSSQGKQVGNYWQNKLGDKLPILELPSSNSRPKVRTYNGNSETIVIEPQLSQQLKQLVKTEAVTISEILLAVFKVLLYRYTGEEDILVGLLQNQENQPLFKGVVGNFTNVAVVRDSISGNLKFSDFLKRVSQTVFEIGDYINYPFALLVQQLSSFNQSHPPITQVAFGYRQVRELFNTKDNKIEYYQLPQQKVDFDLSLEVTEFEESLLACFKYNSDVLEAKNVIKIAEHFHNLLTAIVENPQISIGKLPMLSKEEKQQILVEWNNTTTNYDLSLCMHQLFEAQVEKSRNQVAVVFEREELTYGELNCRANQLARYLQKLGVKPETKVGICVERSLEMVVGLLGILKAGAAYVSFDPGYPPERINYMLTDSQASMLLTQEKLVNQLRELKGQQIICVDRDWEKIERENYNNIDGKVTPENLAYIIYTSGSTGKPKGVQIYHRSLTNFLKSMSQTPGINESDTVVAVTTICFDIAGLELYLPLIVGAKVVIVSRQVSSDGWQLLSTLENSGATLMQATPATWQMLLTVGWQGMSERKFKILCGGEALADKLANQLLDRGAELWNMYGPTETTIWSSVYPVTRPQMVKNISASERVNPIKDKPKSIGKPIANTQIYILDTHLQPLPVGVPGEIYIGGVGVAKGYLHRPELTAQRFIPNPFDYKDSKIYKTGDLARYLPDGNIEYLGRADHQVKIRGFRIETGEIETIINQHPQVKETVVVAREDTTGHRLLVAYIVSGSKPSINELRQFLNSKLPDYMLPSAFVVLSQLPLTPNGKVNRKALPAPDFSDFSERDSFVEPRDRIEQELAKIWSEVLNVERVGAKNNFFELGGHSLLAIKLMAKIQRNFGKQLPLSTLFSSPTVEDLANVVREKNKVKSSSLVPLQTQGNKQPFFCVHPAGGQVFYYLELSRYLGNNQPFYGLQAQGFNQGEEVFTKVEEMAQFYVKIIQEFQPEGALKIGGWSFGGVVAFEMAQQLLQQGREVSLLAILDSWVPILLDSNKKIDNLYLTGALSRYLGGVFGTDNLVNDAELTGLNPSEKIEFIIEKAENLGLFPPENDREENQRFVDVIIGTLKATYAYKRQPYPGKVTVFRPQERHFHAPDPQLVWVELYAILDAVDIDIVMVPGNHYSFMKDPNLKVLAEHLNNSLK